MSGPNATSDAKRRRLLPGALRTANLEHPGDVVGWVDRENAKMEKEGKFAYMTGFGNELASEALQQDPVAQRLALPRPSSAVVT